MSDLILSADTSDRLMLIMDQVHEESSAVYTLLNHSAGNMIAEKGTYPAGDSSIFSALSSASHSSISTMITSLGDELFDSMNLRGKKWTLCILPVNPSVQLVFIFKSEELPALSKSSIEDWRSSLDGALQMFGSTQRI